MSKAQEFLESHNALCDAIYNGIAVRIVENLPTQVEIDRQMAIMQAAWNARDKTICECCGQSIGDD